MLHGHHRIEIEASSQTESYFIHNQKKKTIHLHEIISLVKNASKIFHVFRFSIYSFMLIIRLNKIPG